MLVRLNSCESSYRRLFCHRSAPACAPASAFAVWRNRSTQPPKCSALSSGTSLFSTRELCNGPCQALDNGRASLLHLVPRLRLGTQRLEAPPPSPVTVHAAASYGDSRRQSLPALRHKAEPRHDVVDGFRECLGKNDGNSLSHKLLHRLVPHGSPSGKDACSPRRQRRVAPGCGAERPSVCSGYWNS